MLPGIGSGPRFVPDAVNLTRFPALYVDPATGSDTIAWLDVICKSTLVGCASTTTNEPVNGPLLFSLDSDILSSGSILMIHVYVPRGLLSWSWKSQ